MKSLNNFASLIPALQGSKAIRRVEELRQIGEIQTEAEYNARLSEILQTLNTDVFEPTFEYIPFQPGISSSDQYNLMLDQIRDDLEVAFVEVNNIYAAIQAHNLMFKDKVINELYSALNEMEKETDKLTIVADADNSFDEVFYNNFSGDTYRLDNLDLYAKEIIYDRRDDVVLVDSDSAHIDGDEENLTLPLHSQKEILFSEVSTVGTQSTGTDYNVQLIDSSIDSIITNGDSSGWIYNILKQDTLTGGAKLVIDASLGDKRVINYLSIHPISDFPSVLQKIEYINENNQTVELPNTELFGQSISSPVKISFDDIIASRIIYTFTQRSSTLFSYNSLSTELTIDDLRRNTSVAANAQMFRDQLESQVESVDVISVLPISSPATPEYQVVYQYTFGFTYISAGLSGYRNKGYFVSKPESKLATGLIAFEAQELDTKYFDSVAGVIASVGSFEYSLIKKDYNAKGELIKSLEMPMLPIGKNSVENERLLFTGTRLIVPLRFLGHGTNNSGTGVVIHRNNTPLVRGVDWTFADRELAGNLADPNLKPGTNITRIQILHTSDVIRTGIYTANYTPRHIAEPNNIISFQGVTHLSTNVTEHSVSVGSEAIDKSDLFVKIIVRNNSFHNNKTPKLSSYKLLTSSVNSNKYVRL